MYFCSKTRFFHHPPSKIRGFVLDGLPFRAPCSNPNKWQVQTLKKIFYEIDAAGTNEVSIEAVGFQHGNLRRKMLKYHGAGEFVSVRHINYKCSTYIKAKKNIDLKIQLFSFFGSVQYYVFLGKSLYHLAIERFIVVTDFWFQISLSSLKNVGGPPIVSFALEFLNNF